jgi:hypothetical protein
MKVSLVNKEDRKAVILAIERFMKKEVPDRRMLTDIERSQITAKLVRHLQKEKIKSTAFGMTKKAGSALAKIAFRGAFKAAAQVAGNPS